MPAPIILKIDMDKIVPEWLFKGHRGTYADLVMYENDEPDQYGNSHAIKQNPPKEQRDAGAKGVYVGNGKWMPGKEPRREQPQRQPSRQQEPRDTRPIHEQGESSIPF